MLIKFDLTVLGNVTLDKAELYMYPYSFWDTAAMWDYNMRNGPKKIYRITKEWDIKKATWKIPWSHEGGDFDSLNPVASSSHIDTTVKVWERFDVTGQIKDFIANPLKNNGFLIAFDDNDRRGIMVYSSESREKDKRPKLVINGSDITGTIQKTFAFNLPKYNLIRAVSALRLELPFECGWELATIFALDGRRIAGVAVGAGRNVYTICGHFTCGAYFVRLQGNNNEVVRKFILTE